MSTLSTDQKGHIALCAAILSAARKGFVAFLPTLPQRYDLLIEAEGEFLKVQVKYADCPSPNAQGAVRVELRRRKRRYTKEEIDLLLVYVPKIDKVCCFGPEVFENRGELQLRFEPTRNGQKRGCLIAQDHIW